MEKKFRLTPDQFQFDSEGRLVINREEIAAAVEHRQETEAFPPEEAKTISISIK